MEAPSRPSPFERAQSRVERLLEARRWYIGTRVAL